MLAPESAIPTSPPGAPPVGPLFALRAHKRTKTRSSIAGGNFQSCTENLIRAEEGAGVRERDQGSSTGTGGGSAKQKTTRWPYLPKSLSSFSFKRSPVNKCHKGHSGLHRKKSESKHLFNNPLSAPVRGKKCKYKHTGCIQIGGREEKAHRVSAGVAIITGTLSIIKAK